MLFPRVIVTSLLLAISSVIAAPVSTAGTIIAPVPGAALMPGQPFNFTYNTRADYGVSSYNYTVWVLTKQPNATYPASIEFTAGYFFGRFSAPNYPANPNPTNLAPAQLVVPNFSLSPGGFGAGITATNAPVWVVVLEEYGTGEGVLGSRIGLAYNKVIYNATGNEIGG